MTQAIEEIKSKLEALTQEFADFVANVTRVARTILIPAMEIDLRKGEFYAGLILSEDGTPHEHLIGMPGTFTGTWDDAMAWAASIEGHLPTRREQSLLFANCKGQFDPSYYWSCEQHAGFAGYAWSQYFYDGDQNYYYKSASGRARAVRRLKI